MNLRDKVRERIRLGMPDEALEVLTNNLSEFSSTQQNEILLLSSQLQNWKKDKSLGLTPDEGELRRIEYSVLTLIDEKFTPKGKKTLRKKRVLPFLLILAVVLGYLAITHFNQRDLPPTQGCYIQTGNLTRLVSEPNPFSAQVGLLRKEKYYAVLERKEYLHSGKSNWMYLIHDEEANMKGWVGGGSALQYISSDCLEELIP
ncbi:MAG: hypothetical protein AAF694_24335 [Bacteroidota bacterium]